MCCDAPMLPSLRPSGGKWYCDFAYISRCNNDLPVVCFVWPVTGSQPLGASVVQYRPFAVGSNIYVTFYSFG